MSTKLIRQRNAASVAASPAWNEPPSVTLRENPQRLAWLVILVSFAVFVLLLITIPLSVRYTVRYATVKQPVHLESTQGALRFYAPRSTEPIAVTRVRDDVVEGSIIQAADGSTQGTLRLVEVENPENALGSIRIYSNTSLEVKRIRKPLFERSPEPYRARFYLAQGQVRIFTNSGAGRALHVELETPHGLAVMDAAGQYEVAVGAEGTDITVRSGAASLVNNAGEETTVGEQLRAWMTDDALEQNPMSAAPNLIQNASFTEIEDEGRAVGWEVYGQTERTEGVHPGSVQFIQRDGRGVALFSRSSGVNAHTEIEISQPIEQDVNIFESLRLQLDVRLLHQNLAGGGTLGSEYPLRVEIEYTTNYGQVLTWGHGFYYLDPLEDEDPQNDYWLLDREASTQIPKYQWYTYESDNLVELFAEQNTPIARLNSIRIYASGHKYQSMVSDVYLLAE
jgi:hypothetical protein